MLMLSPQFRPIVGGYERAAERLSESVARAGLGVTVITEGREKSWPAVEHADGYVVRRLPCSYRRHGHAASSLLSFAAFLLRHGREYDVWHVHQYGLHAALAIGLGRLLHRPVALKLTSSGPTGIDLALGNSVGGDLLRACHRRVDACIAVSLETHNEATRFGVPDRRVHTIPNGVSGELFRPVNPRERAEAREAVGLACRRVVLFVGRLSAEKNPLGLLEAFAALPSEARDRTMLVLVGDGPQAECVGARALMPDLHGSVRLAGMQRDVAAWYRAADVYVLPSLTEGLSNTMIEAMASGLPVISTRVSGSSVLRNKGVVAGLVVEVEDTRALTDSMRMLLMDDLMRSDLGANARLLFDSSFSIEVVSQRTIALYRALVAEHQRGEAF